MPFEELGLSSPILQAVDDAGYSEPTPIQKRAIPYILQGRDVLGCAQTGTGKTAGFTLPMIDILSQRRARARMPRSLILEPTRELAAQVAENFEVYGKYHKLNMALLIGGVSFVDQSRIIDRGADVLIATPGRLLDHFERGGLLLRGIDVLVIDEADRMLDMGFIPDVERIVQLCNPKRQTLFFSATMPPEIRRLADIFLDDPTEISVAPPASPAETVDQTVTMVRSRDKDRVLQSLLRSQPVKNALIFCNRKRDVDTVSKTLKSRGFDASALHGDMQQSYRMQTLAKFKNNEFKILVCSDVAARGLDIQGLSHVFLYDVPIHADDYVHRIGRTGRAGMPGRALTLAAPEDGKYLDAVERLIGKPIPRFDPDSQQTGTVPATEQEPEQIIEPATAQALEQVAEQAAEVSSEPASEAVTEAADEAPIAAAVQGPEDAKPVEPATEAASGDDAETEAKPKREGRRRSRGGRGRGNRGEGKSEAREEAKDGGAPESEGEEQPKRGRGARGGGRKRNEGRSEGRGVSRGEGRGEERGRRQGGKRDGQRDGRGDGGDSSVVGMGDHMPAFLNQGTGRKKKSDK
ncbi:MAG: DEAD/DEAH box helicase [Alphaproteobacteria bacterium]|nr:DEAD/DEAH box helicase [Alphaproteobacteria bacterium]